MKISTALSTPSISWTPWWIDMTRQFHSSHASRMSSRCQIWCNVGSGSSGGSDCDFGGLTWIPNTESWTNCRSTYAPNLEYTWHGEWNILHSNISTKPSSFYSSCSLPSNKSNPTSLFPLLEELPSLSMLFIFQVMRTSSSVLQLKST